MKKTRFYILLLLAILLQGIRLAAQTKAQNQIDSLMNAAHQLGVFNGNVYVVQKGKLLYQHSLGYADGNKQRLLNADMLFDIGSISKELNGVGILVLNERGKLKLDDKISKYLGTLPKWADSISIKHLINYTSGLPITAANTDALLQKELEELKHLIFTPGNAYAYSYSNVYLQRRIIEKISGMAYVDFVSKFLLKPLKMDHTFMDLPITDPRMATAFDQNFKNTDYAQNISGWPRLPIGDLYNWVVGLDSYQLVSKASMQLLAKDLGGNESSLGHARFENDVLVWHQHHGSNYNYEALITHDLKNDIIVILMTNSQQFKVSALTNAIMAILKGAPYAVPKRSLYLDLREKVLANFDQGMAFYREVKSAQLDRYDLSFEMGDLVNTGKYLMRRKRFDDAIALFQLGNTLEIKDSDFSYAYQLIAACYEEKGNRQLAILYYQKAVAKDPSNENAKGLLVELLKK